MITPDPLRARVLESLNRIATRAAENAIEYPDESIDWCVELAMLEEFCLYGNPQAQPPKGFLQS